MDKIPQVYDHKEDELINVTQEWCDDTKKALNRLAYKIETIKALASINPITDYEKLQKINLIIQGQPI